MQSCRVAVVWTAVLVAASSADVLHAQTESGRQPVLVYEDVWVRFPRDAKDIRMVTEDADLVIDAARRRLTVRNKKKPLDVAFDDIKSIVFDASTHMRGGKGGAGLGGLLGAAVAASVQGGTVTDYWCVVDYAAPNGQIERYLLEVDHKQAQAVIARMKELLPGRVQEARFEERQREVPKEEWEPFDDDYTVTVKKEQRLPLPRVRQDQALIVVVCPAVDTADTGRGGEYRLYANRTIVALNKMGTHSYVVLEPGRYTLTSKAGNVAELVIELEAGKEYYFFQNTFMGFASNKNTLTRQTKELVEYELAGTYHTEWQPKANAREGARTTAAPRTSAPVPAPANAAMPSTAGILVPAAALSTPAPEGPPRSSSPLEPSVATSGAGPTPPEGASASVTASTPSIAIVTPPQPMPTPAVTASVPTSSAGAPGTTTTASAGSGGQPPAASASQLLELAVRSENARDWPGALQEYEKAKQLDPSLAIIVDASITRVRSQMSTVGADAFARARQYDALGRVVDAITWYERAAQNLADGEPNRTIAVQRLGTLRTGR